MKFSVALGMIGLAMGGVAVAQAPVDAATAACTALQNADLSGLQDAPTQLTAANIVPASADVPAHCRVEGYVAPQVGFDVLLPAAAWNGKLMTVGNGGWAGVLSPEACWPHLRRGYACIQSDTGHKGAGSDGLWAHGNLAAQVDFGYRAVHVSALVGKAVVDRYYSKAPRKSYFMSCSTGGYQGLVEAQRFPWDFDGIIAGAPDMDEADVTMRYIWARKSFFDSAGHAILDAPALKVLHQAVLDQCDRDDGVKDGIVGHPLGCKFKPSILLCSAGQSKECLNAAQVQAAERIYNGPQPPDGRTEIRGALPGSELLWGDKVFGFKWDKTQYFDNLFEHMIYGASAGWNSASFDFDRDYERLGLGALYVGSNPDLRRFKAAGGKLISYQGGHDFLEMPTAVVDYYQLVERIMGSRAATQDFFRLFMIPGVNHCGGGIGAYAIDYLSYLEAWVEQGKPPQVMVGAHVSEVYLAGLPVSEKAKALAEAINTPVTPEIRAIVAVSELKFPLDPTIPIDFTRPAYPYPLYSKYKGTGDPNSADSFAPATD